MPFPTSSPNKFHKRRSYQGHKARFITRLQVLWRTTYLLRFYRTPIPRLPLWIMSRRSTPRSRSRNRRRTHSPPPRRPRRQRETYSRALAQLCDDAAALFPPSQLLPSECSKCHRRVHVDNAGTAHNVFVKRVYRMQGCAGHTYYVVCYNICSECGEGADDLLPVSLLPLQIHSCARWPVRGMGGSHRGTTRPRS